MPSTVSLVTHPMPFRARIVGTGMYVPPRVVTNAEMSKLVETSDEWITSRSGIKERHLIDFEGQMGTADMAEHAARMALDAAGLTPLDLDMIIVGTVTPDQRLPAAAALLQAKLGAHNAAGSIYGMSIAERFVASGAYKRVLVIGGETMSSIVNWTDRATCVLFGDAAGAAILEAGPTDGAGFLDHQLYLDGRNAAHIQIPAGGSKVPLTAELLAQRAERVVMNGRETFKVAVRSLVDAAQTILARNQLTIDDIPHIVAHQANMRIIEAVAERLGVGTDRFVVNIDRYGNTSSASVLMTFDEAKRSGRIKAGDLVLMEAIGAGFAWGAMLYRA